MIQNFTEDQKKYYILLLRYLKTFDLYTSKTKDAIRKGFNVKTEIANFAYTSLSFYNKRIVYTADIIWNGLILKSTDYYCDSYYMTSINDLSELIDDTDLSILTSMIKAANGDISKLNHFRQFFQF